MQKDLNVLESCSAGDVNLPCTRKATGYLRPEELHPESLGNRVIRSVFMCSALYRSVALFSRLPR